MLLAKKSHVKTKSFLREGDRRDTPNMLKLRDLRSK